MSTVYISTKTQPSEKISADGLPTVSCLSQCHSGGLYLPCVVLQLGMAAKKWKGVTYHHSTLGSWVMLVLAMLHSSVMMAGLSPKADTSKVVDKSIGSRLLIASSPTPTLNLQTQREFRKKDYAIVDQNISWPDIAVVIAGSVHAS